MHGLKICCSLACTPIRRNECPVEMKTRMSLAPGDASVADRLKLAGTFHVLTAHFANEKVQGKLDSLSLRSQGNPKQAREHTVENVPVDLQGAFTLKRACCLFPSFILLSRERMST